MAAVVITDVETPAPPRWLMVIRGVLWLMIALVVLSFTPSSVFAIGTMMAIVVIFAGVDELMNMADARSWRWLHGVTGVVFLFFGALAFLEPFQTFGILALFVGWYLLVKGFFDILLAVGQRGLRPMWGLLLAVGVGEILLGLWALGYPGRSAWLLVLWVGTGALLRGVGDLAGAFTHGGAR
jgi:uncharacterized membrane protein HdeD (DUF308 family)